MKRAAALMFSVALAACGGGTEPATEAPAAPAQEGPAALTAGWTATEGIATPESVFYDPASGAIFASQIDGAPDGRDGNGRIARLNADGSVANANFVTGLNAPKGLRVCDGTLWTADIDEVIAIDAATGAIRTRTKIDGAMFLNDVACAGGTAYVTDMMANKIHSVTNGTAMVVAEGADLSFPNGLLVDGNALIVGSWGSQPRPDFSTEVPGHIYRYDLQTKQKTNITQAPPLSARQALPDAVANMADVQLLEERFKNLAASRAVQFGARFQDRKDVVLDGELAEHRGLLGQISQAQPCTTMHGQLGDV